MKQAQLLRARFDRIFKRASTGYATLDFLRDKVPKNWRSLRDSVTDNFRVINPKDFRVLT